jgi:hypothetical protein
MVFEIDPNVLQTPYNQTWEVCTQDVGYVSEVFKAGEYLFCLGWSSGTKATLYKYYDDSSVWENVSDLMTFSGYHHATTLVVNDEIYIFSYGVLRKWNNVYTVSIVADAPMEWGGSFSTVNFFGELEGNICFSKYGTVYVWNNSDTWINIVHMNPGGVQKWESYPDSPYKQSQYRYQLIWSFANDEFPNSTYMAVSEYPMLCDESQSWEGIFGGAPVGSYSYIFTLVSGSWVYYGAVSSTLAIELLGPLLPPPANSYIFECNYNVTDGTGVTIVKNKTTTVAQDNLPDTNVWSNLGMKDSVLYVCNNDGYMRSCDPSTSSIWTKLVLGTYIGEIISYNNNIYTVDYDSDNGTFIYTTGWNKINGLSIIGDYVIKGSNTYFTSTIYSTSNFYSNIFSSDPVLICQDESLNHCSTFYYIGDTWYFVCYNLLYALISGNLVMITGLPEIVAQEDLYDLLSIGTNLYVLSSSTDLLYKLSTPVYSINRINI